MCYIGKGGGWQTKGKGKGKGKFDGVCYNCEKTGHRSRQCWSKRKGKGEQKGKGNETGKGGYKYGGKGFGGKGKGINVLNRKPSHRSLSRLLRRICSRSQQTTELTGS